jgi:hypothetical protein
MDPFSVTNTKNYQLDWVSTRRVKRKLETLLHPVSINSATYNASIDAVVLLTGTTRSTFAKGGQLSIKLRGHHAYYAITGNSGRLSAFKRGVHRTWKHWLNRRDNHGAMTWADYTRLSRLYPLPHARIVHQI